MKLAIGPALKKAGVSQAWLADRIGVSRGFLSEIVSGKKRPSLETLDRMAEELGVSPGDLYEHDVPGLAEPAAQWRGGVKPYGRRGLAAALSVIAPDARRPEPWLLSGDRPGFALRSGDLLVVDMNGAAEPGDIVITTDADPETGEAVTDVSRWLDPWLESDMPSERPRRMTADGRTAILGVVRGSLRGART